MCRVAEVRGNRHGVEPELCREIFTIDVNVRWFTGFMAMKVHPVWPPPQNCRHDTSVTRRPNENDALLLTAKGSGRNLKPAKPRFDGFDGNIVMQDGKFIQFPAALDR